MSPYLPYEFWPLKCYHLKSIEKAKVLSLNRFPIHFRRLQRKRLADDKRSRKRVLWAEQGDAGEIG
jgi:hypothetical protein